MITAVATAGALLLAACGDDGSDHGVASIDGEAADAEGGEDGGGSGDGIPSDAEVEDAMLAYTECMREHGIDMPDPSTSGGGVAVAVEAGEGDDVGHQDFEAADEACMPLIEDVMGSVERDPEAEAEMLDQMTAFAECMRDQGHDMPDPQVSEDGGIVIESRDEHADGGGSAVGNGPAPEGVFDEETERDWNECQDEAGMDQGGGAAAPADPGGEDR